MNVYSFLTPSNFSSAFVSTALPFRRFRSQHLQARTLLTCEMTKAPPTPSTLTKNICKVQVSYILNDTHTPPLLCLHGFGASSLSFLSLFNYLNHETLLAYDAPAFGMTTRPHETRYYTPAFSARIAEHLTESYPSYNVLAHSMGALAAARLENVDKLILIAPALLPRTLSKRLLPIRLVAASFTALSAFLLKLITPLLIPLLTIAVSRESFWKSALTLSRHPSHPPTQAIIQAYKQPLQQPHWQKALLTFSIAALQDRVRALRQSEDFVELLASRPCKIMIIHGQDDAIVPLDNSVRLAERLNAKLVVLEKCGHVPHEECPEIVAAHIKQFLGNT